MTTANHNGESETFKNPYREIGRLEGRLEVLQKRLNYTETLMDNMLSVILSVIFNKRKEL